MNFVQGGDDPAPGKPFERSPNFYCQEDATRINNRIICAAGGTYGK
jgi:hypothetical protein